MSQSCVGTNPYGKNQQGSQRSLQMKIKRAIRGRSIAEVIRRRESQHQAQVLNKLSNIMYFQLSIINQSFYSNRSLTDITSIQH